MCPSCATCSVVLLRLVVVGFVGWGVSVLYFCVFPLPTCLLRKNRVADLKTGICPRKPLKSTHHSELNPGNVMLTPD